MRKYIQYYFKDGEQLTARKLNLRFEDLDLRIHNLEELKVEWESAVSLLQQYGLERINEAIVPLLQNVNERATSLINQLQTELNNLSSWKESVDSSVSNLQVVINNLQTNIDTLDSQILNKAEKDLSNVSSLGNLLNLDGHGSGLDADTVDGKHYSDIEQVIKKFALLFTGGQ